MAEEQSRLLWNWANEKGNVEGFLSDPLKWVSDELEKACDNLPLNRALRRDDLGTIKTLIDIIRIINANRNLLTS